MLSLFSFQEEQSGNRNSDPKSYQLVITMNDPCEEKSPTRSEDEGFQEFSIGSSFRIGCLLCQGRQSDVPPDL